MALVLINTPNELNTLLDSVSLGSFPSHRNILRYGLMSVKETEDLIVSGSSKLSLVSFVIIGCMGCIGCLQHEKSSRERTPAAVKMICEIRCSMVSVPFSVE
jgi:hypothetical protein